MLGFSSAKDFLWKPTSLQHQAGSPNWVSIAHVCLLQVFGIGRCFI